MAFELEKQNAAAAAMEYVEDGMTIGLGTGSTAKYFVELLADEVADGLIVRCIETSLQTRELARSLGVPLIPFEQVDRIHLTVDGADEAGPGGVLIKGGGAALLREKIIANASDHMVVIADPTKEVQALGAFPLPVEVTPFGYTITAKKVHDALSASGVARPRVELRKQPGSHDLLVTDGGNYILDCHCTLIPDPPRAAAYLSGVPGVVEHGLFIGLARTVIFGTETGARIISIDVITEIADYFDKGCGRCERFATADCSVQRWTEGLAALRRICLAAGLTETVKWGHPVYMHAGRNITLFGAFRNDFRMSFFNPGLMQDPEGILEKAGPNTREAGVVFFRENEAPAQMEKVLRAYITEAMRYAEQGILPQKTAQDIELPDELVEALDADPELAEAFHALTPGQQRSYVINLNGAKASATRQARIAKFRSHILAGKGATER